MRRESKAIKILKLKELKTLVNTVFEVIDNIKEKQSELECLNLRFDLDFY